MTYTPPQKKPDDCLTVVDTGLGEGLTLTKELRSVLSIGLRPKAKAKVAPAKVQLLCHDPKELVRWQLLVCPDELAPLKWEECGYKVRVSRTQSALSPSSRYVIASGYFRGQDSQDLPIVEFFETFKGRPITFVLASMTNGGLANVDASLTVLERLDVD